MSDRVIRHVVVRGRVQGVGYRAFVEDEAHKHGLHGWVRNRRDGGVEAVFSGAAEAVAQMIKRCQHGPPSARVDFVKVLGETQAPAAGFEVRPTA